MKRKSTIIPLFLAIFGPLLLFVALWAVSVQIAKSTPEDELPPLEGAIGAQPFAPREHYLYLTVVLVGEDGSTPAEGGQVEVIRRPPAGEEEQRLRSHSDTAGLATFTLPKTGELEVQAPGFRPAGAGQEETYRMDSLARHPDEFLEITLRRSGEDGQ